LFSIAKRTLPVLDPFFLGSARYAVGVLLFIAILWIAEGRQALRYNGRFLPAAVYGVKKGAPSATFCVMLLLTSVSP